MAQKMSCLFTMIFTQKGVTQHTKLLKQDGINEAGDRSRAAGISGFGSPGRPEGGSQCREVTAHHRHHAGPPPRAAGPRPSTCRSSTSIAGMKATAQLSASKKITLLGGKSSHLANF